MLHEKKKQQKQQEVRVVGKRKSGAAMVMVDGMAQLWVRYVKVEQALPPAEGEKQGQIVEWEVEMR